MSQLPTGGANPKKRRVARRSAVQALYQMEVGSAGHKAVIREFLDHRFGGEDEAGRIDAPYFEVIVNGGVAAQAEIDTLISEKLSKGWPLRRLDATLRALLRAATYELILRPDVPALVIINEYMAISGEFFSGKEPGVVNGVLDSIAKQKRAAEFGLTPSHIAPARSSSKGSLAEDG